MLGRFFFLGILALTAVPLEAQVSTPQVGGGQSYSCALGKSGRAFCWGVNTSGQLGNNMGVADGAQVSRPTEIAGSFVTMTAGARHACALQADGTAYCWGHNVAGQLGIGTAGGGTIETGISLPQRVMTTIKFKAISAGSGYTCALDLTGRAWCWGDNSNLELGYTSFIGQIATPNAVLPPSVGAPPLLFTAISAGVDHTCAIDVSGVLWCWGNDTAGRAGLDLAGCQNFPSVICEAPQPVATTASVAAAAIKFTKVSAGEVSTCGIATTGALFCWGLSLRGSMAVSATPDAPALVTQVVSAVDVSVGPASACAVAASGQLFCWGANDFGQLGDGKPVLFGSSNAVPQQVSGPQDYVSVSVGFEYACGRTKDGSVRCWGHNESGQLGVGTVSGSATSTPALVLGLQSTAISAGLLHMCSLDPDGVLACWGDNTSGELGNGLAVTVPSVSLVPTPVARFYTEATIHHPPGPAPAPPEQLSNVLPMPDRFSQIAQMSFSEIAVGWQHACGIGVGGATYCWGADQSGQVGNGQRVTAPCRFGTAPIISTCVPAPTIVSRNAAHRFTRVSAGPGHNCAINQHRQIFCWGSAASGELGSAVQCPPAACFARVPTPVRLKTNPPMLDVGTGDGSSCSTSGKTVYCWGQIIGGGSTPTAQQFRSALPKYARVGTGAGFACASTNNQTLECIGDDIQGQLGDGTNTPSTIPRLVLGHKFSTFHLSENFACGIDLGAVACWGFNGNGQLGNGTTVKSNTPVSVLSNGFTAVNVGVGYAHACAIDASGTLICWGSDGGGELGDGVPVPAPATAPVSVAGGWAVP